MGLWLIQGPRAETAADEMDGGRIIVLAIWENPDKSEMKPDLSDMESLARAHGISLADVCG